MKNPIRLDFIKALVIDLFIIAAALLINDMLTGTELFAAIYISIAVIYAVIHTALETVGIG